MAHRTAARILSKGITEGRYGGELAIDDMPYIWRWSPPPAPTASSPTAPTR
jgi:hypothetical protein